MAYQLRIKKSAEKELDGLPLSAVLKIKEKILELSVDPLPHGVKKLKGFTGLYRIRIGNYRAVYNIDHQNRIIEFLKIGDRKDIYD